eukprot:gnl/TRDRNA2_/TRDRNA2_46334_c0_seq1.p1 gnl/TRDRNA2_/TRDRNA2_46334_c0~~gnl/TRDRNA2_/TRDRNA2_46334_c0_seq1.p1  ORF type:complete len:235 (-),score=34.35 gnl/TRDRNA2_/TRDRNA2_46334_c0_seq1:138-842(-)
MARQGYTWCASVDESEDDEDESGYESEEVEEAPRQTRGLKMEAGYATSTRVYIAKKSCIPKDPELPSQKPASLSGFSDVAWGRFQECIAPLTEPMQDPGRQCCMYLCIGLPFFAVLSIGGEIVGGDAMDCNDDGRVPPCTQEEMIRGGIGGIIAMVGVIIFTVAICYGCIRGRKADQFAVSTDAKLHAACAELQGTMNAAGFSLAYGTDDIVTHNPQGGSSKFTERFFDFTPLV